MKPLARKRLLAVLILALALPLAAGAWLLYSTAALRWVLETGGALLPGRLTIESVGGRLAGPLQLDGLRYEDGDLRLACERLELDWRPSRLLAGTLAIRRLESTGVVVTARRAERPSSAPVTGPPPLALPVAVELTHFELHDLRIRTAAVATDTPSKAEGEWQEWRLTRVTASARYRKQTLNLRNLHVQAPRLDARLRGRVQTRGDYPLHLALRFSATPTDLAAFEGTLEMNGDLQRLQLQQELLRPWRGRLQATLHTLLTDPAWQARLEWEALNPAAVRAGWMAGRIGGQVESRGRLQAYTLQGRLQGIVQEQRFRAHLQAAGNGEQLQIKTLELRLPGSGTLLTSSGELRHNPLAVDLRGHWQNLSWPLAGRPRLRSAAGDYRLQGTRQDLRIHLDGALAVPAPGDSQSDPQSNPQSGPQPSLEIPRFSAQARLADRSLRLERLNVRVLNGRVSGTGRMHWQDQPGRDLAWELSLQAQGVDPGRLWPQWPGRLTLAVASQGKGIPGRTGSATLILHELGGTLRDRPLWGRGTLRWRASGTDTPSGRPAILQIEPLILRIEAPRQSSPAAPSRAGAEPAWLVLAGSVETGAAGRLALSALLDIPHLEDIVPGAGGRLALRAQASGPWRRPALEVDLSGAALQVADYRAGHVQGRLRWRPERRDSNLSLQALEVTGPPGHLRQLALTGRGTPAEHTLDLWLDGATMQLLARLQGRWAQSLWQGRLPFLRLAAAGLVWQAGETSAPLRLGSHAVTLPRWCLHSDRRRLCLRGHWRRGGAWQAGARGEALPLDWLRRQLPFGLLSGSDLPLLDLAGAVSFTATVQGKGRQVAAGHLELQGRDTRLRLVLPRGEPLPLQLRELQLRARLHEGRVRLAGDVRLAGEFTGRNAAPDATPDAVPTTPAELGRLTARFELPVPALEPADQRLAGHAELRLQELRFVTLLLPEIEAPGGRLETRLELEGSLEQPRYHLALTLRDGQFRLPALGITPRALQLEVRNRGRTLHYRGSVVSGPGRLELNGTFLPARKDWRLAARLQGQDFLLGDTPEYRIQVSPDLELQLDARQALLTGTVRMPRARIKPRRLTTSLRPSPDVVIATPPVSRKAPGQPRTSRTPARETTLPSFTGIVRFELGQEVRFEGFGLRARLAGNVVILELPGRLTTATGELQILEGRYRAYGQDLRIERGRLVFVGGPIDNPGLDIRAVRRVREVTVGLQISGDAIQPLVRIFSNPPMSESDALAYLVLGRPPGRDDRSDQERLAAAATALGVGGASRLGKRLGERLGLEEMTVETEQDSGEIRLRLGTYLSPRLYVGYGWGMMEQLNTLLLRYRLSEHLTLEAQSSNQSASGDLFFTLERGQ